MGPVDSGSRLSFRHGQLPLSWAIAAILGLLLTGACTGGGDRPDLKVLTGPRNPGAAAGLAGDTDVPLLQFGLLAEDDPVLVSEIRFHASGSGDDAAHLAKTRLYLDGNDDGALDAGDTLLATAGGYSADEGELLFSGMSESLPARARVHWLLVYDIRPGPSSGKGFCASLESAADVTATVGPRHARVAVADGIQGCLTVPLPVLSLGRGPNTPPGGEVIRCASDVVVLQMQLDAGFREDISVESVTFTASGTLDDSRDILEVRLHVDEDGDGELDPTDLPLGSPAGYAVDDGTVTFSGLGSPLAASSSERWLLVYDLASTTSLAETFAASVIFNTDISARGSQSGQPTRVLGAPVSGDDHLTAEPMLVSAIYDDANADGLVDAADTVLLNFTLEVKVEAPLYAHWAVDIVPAGNVGRTATLFPGPSPTSAILLLSEPATFKPHGIYGVDPESSGLNLAFGQTHLSMCPGTYVQPAPAYLDMTGILNPRVNHVDLIDASGDCTADAGDWLEVIFTSPVTIATSDPTQAFRLTVSGDSLGQGAQFLGGSAPTNTDAVTIVLGANPVLTPEGDYDPATLAPGSPSGLDVVAAPGVIVDSQYPVLDALPRWLPGLDIPDLAMWTSRGDDEFAAEYGRSAACAGDVNGDGYDDIIVGQGPLGAFQGRPGPGKAYLYVGGPDGPSRSPDWTSVGDNQWDSGFGAYPFSIASAGDVNGDGFSDVIVSAFMQDTAHTQAGKAFVYLGGIGGLSPTAAWTSSGDDLDHAFFGYSVATAGDVNGDGYSDVVVGSAAKAFLYAGGPAGLGSSPAWTSTGEGSGSFGISVSSAGDVNGDGYSDVIVGAPRFDVSPWVWNAGKVYLYLGEAGGVSTASAWTSSGLEEIAAEFGWALSSAGDVNNDGLDDVVIGAPEMSHGGAAFVYPGDPAGLRAFPFANGVVSGLSLGGSGIGLSVSSPGDVNGDGYSDILLGSQWGQVVFILHGDATGLAWPPAWSLSEPRMFPSFFGLPAVPAGDVNGDGFLEIIVGAPYFDTAHVDAGKAWVYCLRP